MKTLIASGNLLINCFYNSISKLIKRLKFLYFKIKMKIPSKVTTEGDASINEILMSQPNRKVKNDI